MSLERTPEETAELAEAVRKRVVDMHTETHPIEGRPVQQDYEVQFIETYRTVLEDDVLAAEILETHRRWSAHLAERAA